MAVGAGRHPGFNAFAYLVETTYIGDCVAVGRWPGRRVVPSHREKNNTPRAGFPGQEQVYEPKTLDA